MNGSLIASSASTWDGYWGLDGSREGQKKEWLRWLRSMRGVTRLLAWWMRLDYDDDENSSICKDEVKISMFIKKEPEFQCLEG